MTVARTVLELLDGAADATVDVDQVGAALERAAGPRTAVAVTVATVAELVPDPDSLATSQRSVSGTNDWP